MNEVEDNGVEIICNLRSQGMDAIRSHNTDFLESIVKKILEIDQYSYLAWFFKGAPRDVSAKDQKRSYVNWVEAIEHTYNEEELKDLEGLIIEAIGERFQMVSERRGTIDYPLLFMLKLKMDLRMASFSKEPEVDIIEFVINILKEYEHRLVEAPTKKMAKRMFLNYCFLYEMILQFYPELDAVLRVSKHVSEFFNGPMSQSKVNMKWWREAFAKDEATFHDALIATMRSISPGITCDQIKEMDKSRDKEVGREALAHLKKAKEANADLNGAIFESKVIASKELRDEELEKYVRMMIV